MANTQWGNFGGASLQGGFRIGKSSSVSGMSEIWDAGVKAMEATAESIFISRFYAYYFSSFYTGGYYFFAPYKLGESTVYRIRDRESDSSYSIERAFLAADADGGHWWRLKFYQGEQSVLYEFKMTDDTHVSEIYYSENGNPAVRVVPSKTDIADVAAYYDDALVVEDFKSKAVSKETVRVGAGHYEASFLSKWVIADEGAPQEYSWWLTDSVPGGLVKYTCKSDDDDPELSLESVGKKTSI
ncbi:hypothetical protein MASR2M48_18590 [Spirochaetota bacterium]